LCALRIRGSPYDRRADAEVSPSLDIRVPPRMDLPTKRGPVRV